MFYKWEALNFQAFIEFEDLRFKVYKQHLQICQRQTDKDVEGTC